MNISEINNVAKRLGDYFNGRGIIGGNADFSALYLNGSVPTSELPESFLEIIGNGPLSSGVSQFGICDYTLSLIVNVKLLSDGTINDIRESYLMQLIELNFDKTIVVDNYHYSLNKQTMVYSGRDLISGYSSKIININVKIY